MKDPRERVNEVMLASSGTRAWASTGAVAALGIALAAALTRGLTALRGRGRMLPRGDAGAASRQSRRALLKDIEPFVERSSEAVAVLDAAGVVTYVSPVVRRLLDYEAADVVGRDAYSFVHPDDAPAMARAMDDALAAPGRSIEFTVRVRHRNGSWRAFAAVGTNLLDRPAVGGLVINARDVTEERRAECAAALTEEVARAVAGGATVDRALARTLALVCDASGWECGEAWLVNDTGHLERAASYHGGDERALRFLAGVADVSRIGGPSIPGRVAASGRVLLIRDLSLVKGFPRAALAKELGILTATAVPIQAGGDVVGVLAFFSSAVRENDEWSVRLAVAAAQQLGGLAGRRRVEARLHEQEVQYRELFEDGPDGAILQEDGHVTVANAVAAGLLGYASPDEMAGRDLMAMVHPDSRQRAAERVSRLRAGKGNPLECLKLVRADGRVVHADVASRPVVAGGHHGVYITLRDATARVRAEEELRESEERFRLALKATRDVVWDWDPATDAMTVSDALGRVFGHDAPGGRTTRAWWWSLVHPDDADRVLESARAALDGASDEWLAEYRLRCGDGRYAVVLDRGYVIRGPSGRATRVVGAAADVSTRRSLEEQLRHAQKMEALGLLASGVAHDFNNVLTSVTIHGEMLLDAIPPGDPARSDAEEIRRAAERATSLTRQLLIFGRRQAARVEPLDLNDVVGGVQRMLERLLGGGIELVTRLAAELPRVAADRGQLEQVLLNLAINARDAMPAGGVIVIETSQATLDDEHARRHPGASAGRHALLAVTDTGHGMDDATRARVFEPFFTTKPEGKGTGLGLSIVAGIVRESGGHVYLYSEPQRGTTFKIYLPAAAGDAPRIESGADAVPGSAAGTTILLVDDDDSVRVAACRVLERLGYRVIEASSAGEAMLRVARESAVPRLVLTDLTVGDESGVSIAERVRARHPSARVLFMSGYGEAAVTHLELVGGAPYVEKPFTAEDLERKVRRALA